MDHFTVVIYNHYLHSPSAVVGPFTTRDDAVAWMNAKDEKLSKDESMAVHVMIDRNLILH